MRHVDRRTNALPDRPTDTASYRGALSHLKSVLRLSITDFSALLTMICSVGYEVLCNVEGSITRGKMRLIRQLCLLSISWFRANFGIAHAFSDVTQLARIVNSPLFVFFDN